MHHIFIHPSVDGLLGCFNVLAVVNNAPLNIGIHTSSQIIVFCIYMPMSGIAGHRAALVFGCVCVCVCVSRNSMLFSIVAISIY